MAMLWNSTKIKVIINKISYIQFTKIHTSMKKSTSHQMKIFQPGLIFKLETLIQIMLIKLILT